MKNYLIFGLLSIVLVNISCSHDTEFNKYFLGEKFIITSDEPATVVDTSNQFLDSEENALVFTEYYIQLKSLIIEARCPPDACFSCYGGLVKIECKITTNNPNIESATGIVEYPSCIDGDLELYSGAITTISIGEIEFYCHSILPSYVEDGELKDYFVKFTGIK